MACYGPWAADLFFVNTVLSAFSKLRIKGKGILEEKTGGKNGRFRNGMWDV